MVQPPQAPQSQVAASQAVRELHGCRESSFWSKRGPAETDSCQSSQASKEQETELALVENSHKAAGRAGQDGLELSPPLSKALQQHRRSPSTFIPLLADVAGLETITCKRSSFTDIAVH